MARPKKKKRLELKAVDGETPPIAAVVRLENPETGHKSACGEPVRLVPPGANEEPSRLELPSREEMDMRTFQPGIDVLIDDAAASPESSEDEWGNMAKQRPLPWGWFVLIGLVIAGALGWSLVHLKDAEPYVGRIRTDTESVLATEVREEKQARELVDRIESALKRYFTTVTVEALARHSRHSQRVLPLIRAYYSGNPLRVNPIKSIRALQPVTLDKRADFWIASVTLCDGKKSNLIIELDSAGNPLIDWETLVCFQPMPWDQFAHDRPVASSMDFRVYAEADTFFSHEFSDKNGWLCFRLTALESEQSMFGYVIADSAEGRAMLDVIQKSCNGRASVILRLGIPERLQSPQGVVIEKMLSNRWIYLDPPPTDS